MVIFAIVMIVLALLAAVGFIVANRSGTTAPQQSVARPQQAPQPKPAAPVERPVADIGSGNEDVITYLPADIPTILQEALSAVPLATVEEAVMGCYGTMGTTQAAAGKQEIRPFQTNSLDELTSQTTFAISCMESEQHISKFTISIQKKSKTNPHVDVFAHSTEPKRIRLIRFWRTQEGFVSTLPTT
jgi:hypothetical protein